MADKFDIVVAGAGHNSLVAAAYLAKAGYRCLVLEGRSVLGGNVVTEELTLPGFRHDSCGTAHVILQDSPMMRNDELGLADYGLEYIHPEIVCHAPFLDGSWLTQYHDIERTIEQFAKFSKKDAAAYRRMIAEYDAIKPLFDAASYTPIGFGKPINDRLNEHPDGRKWLRRQAQSAWEIIRDNFEDDHSRCFMLWMAFQTVTPPEWPMTGRNAYSLAWGRQRWSWCIPKGGSGVLTEILVRLIEDHGGVALTNKMVQGLIVENGQCVGVECADGSSYRADKAVLSTIHIKHLIDMAPREAWADDFVDGVETWQGGPTLFVQHYATSEPMTFQGDGGTDHADRLRDAVGADAGAAHGLRLRPRRRRTSRSRCCSRCRRSIGDPTPGAAGPSHHQDHRHAALRPEGGAAALGQHQAPGGGRQPELAAEVLAQSDRRQDPGPRGREPARSGAAEPAQLARLLPRRRAERGAGGGASAGARLGAAPHADRGPLPDRFHDASRRLDLGRAGT